MSWRAAGLELPDFGSRPRRASPWEPAELVVGYLRPAALLQAGSHVRSDRSRAMKAMSSGRRVQIGQQERRTMTRWTGCSAAMAVSTWARERVCGGGGGGHGLASFRFPWRWKVDKSSTVPFA